MLQFHLPKVCPHGIVLHHYRDGLHTFVCHACEGALEFNRKAWHQVLRVAFCTLGDRALRKHCLDYINGSAKPTVSSAPDVKGGYKYDLFLKPDSQSSDGAKQVKNDGVEKQQASREWS